MGRILFRFRTAFALKAAFLASLLLSIQFGFAQAVYSPGAIVAKRLIEFQGSGIYMDSFDSTDTNKSTAGLYDPNKYSGDVGDIFPGLSTNLNLGSSHIYGHVHDTTGALVIVPGTGAVGSHAWQSSNAGIEPNWVVESPSVTFPDTTLPGIIDCLDPSGPYTNITGPTVTVSTNELETYPTYFVPPPGQFVTTNIIWTTNESYPGPIYGLVTNPEPAATSVVCPNYPAPGTYVGPVTTNTQYVTKPALPPAGCYVTTPPPVMTGPGKYTFQQITYSFYPILNYAFSTTTYTYWEVSTNSGYITNVYDYVLSGDTKYFSESLSRKSVYVQGSNTTLVLPNGLYGSESFTLSDGASLRICAGGITAALDGAKITGNVTPASFVVSCAPVVTSLSVSQGFTGEIVAPNAYVWLRGDDFSGFIMADRVVVTGPVGIHFDESLISTLESPLVNYAVSGGAAYVTNSPDASGRVFIASTYNGYPVTSIASHAFQVNTNITSITIPSSVFIVGDYAFNYCTSLTNITLGDSLTSIGFAAFLYCSNLTRVTIPASVSLIGNFAFGYCTSLTNFSVDTDSFSYSSLDGVLFDKAQTTLVAYPEARAGGSYVVPNGVTIIGVDAFLRCYSLTNITIPNSVTLISDNAFYLCQGLTSLAIPENVTTIRDLAFANCASLTNITFRGNAPSGAVAMFNWVGPDAKVYYYYGTTSWSPTYYGLPTVMLDAPPAQIPPGNIGVTPGGFGFTINGVANQTIVIEASTNLVDWQPVWTNTFSETSADFVDPESTNFPSRFYRARSN